MLAYIDFRRSLIAGAPAAYTCLAGTMTQEVFDTNPDILNACRDSIFGHAATLEADIADALTDAARADGVTAASLALRADRRGRSRRDRPRCRRRLGLSKRNGHQQGPTTLEACPDVP